MTKEEIIDNLELYTVSRPKKDQVSITVEELQNLIDEIKALEQQPSDDCVSRQALIDMAKSYNTDGYDCYTPLVVDVEDIEELPSVTPTQRWIPVSERLPKEGQRVFVTQIVSERTVVYCTTFPFDKTKEKYIIAWMPLPKPYEEKRGSENEVN